MQARARITRIHSTLTAQARVQFCIRLHRHHLVQAPDFCQGTLNLALRLHNRNQAHFLPRCQRPHQQRLLEVWDKKRSSRSTVVLVRFVTRCLINLGSVWIGSNFEGYFFQKETVRHCHCLRSVLAFSIQLILLCAE